VEDKTIVRSDGIEENVTAARRERSEKKKRKQEKREEKAVTQESECRTVTQ
jgi:hypothetical protein